MHRDLLIGKSLPDNLRIIRATDATHRWRDYRYTAIGQPSGQSLTGVDTGGNVALLDHSSTAFDALDRPVSRFDSAGHATQSEYDETGNVTAITNPDGYTIRFEYDANNRPTRAFDEHGRAVTTDYDIGGRPIRVTDPNGNSTRDNIGRETRTDFDALNRPIRSIGPLHNSHGLSNIRQVTLTVYDTLGFVKEIRAGTPLTPAATRAVTCSAPRSAIPPTTSAAASRTPMAMAK